MANHELVTSIRDQWSNGCAYGLDMRRRRNPSSRSIRSIRGRVLDHGQNREAHWRRNDAVTCVSETARLLSPGEETIQQEKRGEPDGGYGSYPCIKSVGNHGRTIPETFSRKGALGIQHAQPGLPRPVSLLPWRVVASAGADLDILILRGDLDVAVVAVGSEVRWLIRNDVLATQFVLDRPEGMGNVLHLEGEERATAGCFRQLGKNIVAAKN